MDPDDVGPIVFHPMGLQSRQGVIQPGFKPGIVVTPLALRCSALDRCATWQRPRNGLLYDRCEILYQLLFTVVVLIDWYETGLLCLFTVRVGFIRH